jgi:TatD DNase family protein
MKLGIGGVDFKNGKSRPVLNQIALEHIVLETDSYLAPVPYRGNAMRAVILYIL